MSSARLFAAGAAVAIVVAVPLGAHAKPVAHERYAGSDSGRFDECGLSLRFNDTFSGQFLLREVKGSGGQAFLAHDNYRFRTILTNADNGAWMVIRGRGLFKEVSARHLGGDIWEFISMDVGQPLVVEDSDGDVVLRDRGRLTFRGVFDTLGDGQPGGELIESELTGVHGPHPSFDTDFCEVVTDLIG